MNKRIGKLAEQAGLLGPSSRVGNSHDATEKFAQLIVQECLSIVEPVLDEPYEDMSEFGKGLVEGQDVAVEKIKRHFGVEE